MKYGTFNTWRIVHKIQQPRRTHVAAQWPERDRRKAFGTILFLPLTSGRWFLDIRLYLASVQHGVLFMQGSCLYSHTDRARHLERLHY